MGTNQILNELEILQHDINWTNERHREEIEQLETKVIKLKQKIEADTEEMVNAMAKEEEQREFEGKHQEGYQLTEEVKEDMREFADKHRD